MHELTSPSKSTSPSCPADDPADTPTPRTYANFCSIAHTPFDFTLTFCEVMPLSEKEIKEAETEHVVRAPVRVKVVVPVQFVPNLIARPAGALARLLRVLQQRRLEQGRRAIHDRTDRSEREDAASETARTILDKLEAQHPDADTELHYRNAVRAAGGDDPVGAVDRPAREHGDARAVQAISGRARAGAARRRRSSSRRSIRPGSSARNRRRSIGMAQALVDRSRRRGAGRHGRARSRCRASAARRPTSSSGTRWACPGLPVDRHVLRVANRIGIAESRRSGGRRAATVRARCRRSDGRAPRTR